MSVGRPAQPRAGVFVGRDRELRQLARLADEARDSKARLAVVEGEPGIGKTALVTTFLRDLEDFTVLQAFGDPVESELRFGVLRQLLARLPRELQERVSILEDPVPANMTAAAAGAEALALVGELAAARPVVVVIDDAQWCDADSMNAVRFVFRRLWADRVLGLVMARGLGRSGPSSGPDVPGSVVEDWARVQVGDEPAARLSLSGLDAPEVSALAEQLSGVRPDPAAGERLRSYTTGHPLWLRLLLAELSPEVLSGDRARLSVPQPLASMVRRQRERLGPQSRDLIDALAVLDRRSPLALVGAVAEVDSPADALDEALDAGLVDWWPGEPSSPVAIRHQLLRDAIYAALEPVRRRRLHALAAPQVPADDSWAHRVAATDHMDGQLTEELEKAAGDMLRTGEVGRAATLLQWAAEISPSSSDRERFILTAAGHLLAGQQVQRAQGLTAAVESCSPSPMRSVVLGSLATFRGAFTTAEPELKQALELSQNGGDTAVAAVAARALAGLYVWVGAGDQAAQAARTALAVGASAPHLETTAKTMLLIGLLQSKGARGALRAFPEIAGQTTDEPVRADIDAYLLSWRGSLNLLAGEIDRGVDDLTAAMALVEPIPGNQVDVHNHYWLAHALYLLGEWPRAAIHADRALAFAMADNRAYLYAPCHTVAAMVAAGMGDWASAETHARAARALVAGMGPDHYVVYPALAEATIAQARFDYSAIGRAIEPLAARPELRGFPLALQPWWRPLQVESHIMTGNLPAAGEALDGLRRTAEEAPYLYVAVAWLSGLLAEAEGRPKQAQAAYEEGLSLDLSHDRVPLYRAFLERSYARSLRPENGKTAISWLRQAHERFAALNAVPFLNRSTEELGRWGVTGDAAPSVVLDLTGREREIAHVVAGGLTNAEAAKAMYVSEKTIEYHLSRIYAKLGITRRELARAVRASH